MPKLQLVDAFLSTTGGMVPALGKGGAGQPTSSARAQFSVDYTRRQENPISS